jgi:multiple sugar transport system permease protein
MAEAAPIAGIAAAPAIVRARKHPAQAARDRIEAMAAWRLAGPAAFLLILLLLGPSAAVIVISFTDWQLGVSTIEWNGVANYVQLFGDSVFWRSLGNTLFYVGIVVPGSVFLGLGAAMLIESDRTFRGIYRTAYFLPVTATIAAMALVWEFLFHPSIGPVNLVLEQFGFREIDWLKEPETALPVLCVIGIWQMVGLNMVLFMAGLKSIPPDLYEAADVDGADSAWERFRTVTWPMLGPATVFVGVISAIRSFQVFDTVAILTQGGPNKATEVLLHTMYTEGFSFFRTGYASAITVVFLIIVFALTILQAWFSERRVHYS